MSSVSRRYALQTGAALVCGAQIFAGCNFVAAHRSRVTSVYVIGTIHRRHRTSSAYSLAVLETAIIRAKPDVIITEIPPDRARTALATYRQTGEITEPRTRVFPEYTDIVIPLSERLGWRVVGAAAWTPEIAANRRKALRGIEQDTSRAKQWAEHKAANRAFAKAVAGRSDDPRFIHTDRFDHLVAASREPYARHFDADLGAGGWTAINRAHIDLIGRTLDAISGQGLTAIITFGTAHKYKILASLKARDDIALKATRPLFG